MAAPARGAQHDGLPGRILTVCAACWTGLGCGPRSPRRLLACALLIEAALIGMLLIGDFRDSMPQFLAYYGVAFGAFAVAITPLSGAARDGADQLYGLCIIMAAAVLFRLTLWPSEPSLSDDIYRYLWDGKVYASGVNPYQHVPGARAVSALRDAQFTLINHRDFGTPYGPLSQWVFLLAHAAGAGVAGMKALFLLLDMGCIGLLAVLLRQAGQPSWRLAIYAWNPLVLVEIAGSGHNDPLAVGLLLAVLALLAAGWRSLAATAFAAVLLAKYFALLALPLVWKRLRNRDRLLCCALVLLGFLPFADALEEHLLALLAVGADWQFNAGLYLLIAQCCDSTLAAKAVALGLFGLVLVWLWYSDWPTSRTVFTALGAALVLTTTLQPWYLLWIAPFLALHPNRAWLTLMALTMLAYLPYHFSLTGGTWYEPGWLKLLIYVPFFGLLLHDGWTRRTVTGAA